METDTKDSSREGASDGDGVTKRAEGTQRIGVPQQVLVCVGDGDRLVTRRARMRGKGVKVGRLGEREQGTDQWTNKQQKP